MQRDSHDRKNSHPGKEQAYAGRWVAYIKGRIVGQGGTPEQALGAAKANRYKENPQIKYIPMTVPLTFPPLFQRLQTVLAAEDMPVYLVGGAVRDMLLSRPIHDYDFVLPGNALKVAKRVADQLDAAYYPLDIERFTARVIHTDQAGQRQIIDFASLRGANLEADLWARDFTINAIALDVRKPEELLDPLGGVADLLSKKLRACGPQSFMDDPIRVLRAIRLASSFGMHIQPETRQQMKSAVVMLPQVSAERLRDEIFRILNGKQPHTSLLALEMLDTFPHILPELTALKGVTQSPPHTKAVWDHTLDVLRCLEIILRVLAGAYNPESSGSLMVGIASQRLGRYRSKIAEHLGTATTPERDLRALLFFAALYHDIAKPHTRSVEEDGRIRFFTHDQVGESVIAERANALKLSNEEISRLKIIVRHHMRPSLLAHEVGGPSRRAIYRFFRDTGAAGVDICLLSLADVWATYGTTLPQERWERQIEVVRSMLEAWWERAEEQIAPPSLLNGDDLMLEFSLQPGPQIGDLLEAIREAQAVGEINNREEAFDLVRNLLSA